MDNLSTKEIDNIQNIMIWELLAAKKCLKYAAQETDPVSQNMFSNIGNIHKQNYLIVLEYLDQLINKSG